MLQKTVRDDPRLFDARLNFGAVTLAYKDSSTAIEQFAQAVLIRPTSVEARLGQAVALRGLGKAEDAQRVLVDLARDPNNADVRFNLCLLYQENLNKLEQAVGECNAFLRLAPANHPKRKEATRRIESLGYQIEAEKSGATLPAPAAVGSPVVVPPPATGAAPVVPPAGDVAPAVPVDGGAK